MCAVLALQLNAQQPVEKPVEKEDNGQLIQRVDVGLIGVPVTVTSKGGKTVNGLQASDFKIYDNGHPQNNVGLDVTFHPVSIVMAIQANSDVEGMLPKIQKVGSLLESIVGESGEAAVVVFDHRIRLLQDFTSDTGKITDAVKKIKVGSSSAMLNDTILYSVDMLKHRPKDHRKIILAFTETRDKGSNARLREVLVETQFADVVIYTIDISRLLASCSKTSSDPGRPPSVPAEAGHSIAGGGALNPTTQMQNMGTGNVLPGFAEIFKQVKGIFVDNPLEVYTKWTGGREYSFRDQSTLERAIADMGEEIRSQYLLTYKPTGEGGYHDIRVDVLGLGGDLHVRAKKGYYIGGPKAN
jgi:VWFA-related protein